MEDIDLQLLNDELSTQLNAYRCNQFSEDIINHFSPSKTLVDSSNVKEVFSRIKVAKNEWETCVDSLEDQAMIVLDSDLKIIRTNRTIESWGWADIDKVKGRHILDLIKPAIDNESDSDWLDEWSQLDLQTNVKWELENYYSGKKYRFSFYPVRDLDSFYHLDNCYAVLSISDITDDKVVKINKLLHDRRSSDADDKSNQINLVEIAELKANQLAEQLIKSQELERNRVSSELHDGLGQILTALKFQVGSVVAELNESSQQRKNDAVLKDVLVNIKVALSDLKTISVDLKASVIDDLGLLMALKWFVSKYKNVYTDLEVDMQLDVYESKISDDKKNVIYRIIQEAMCNIAKHAHANKVFLQLTSSCHGLLLRISDDGCGFNINDKKSGTESGLGLKNMEDRAVNSGAKFVMRSNSNTGTIIQIFWGDN